jgi:hypothetical protein
MKGKKRMVLLVCVFFVLSLGSSAFGQNLSKIYVTEIGNVLGAILRANPGYPCSIYINGFGLLVWIDIEIPNALIEVYSDGYLRLIETTPSTNIHYDMGRIQKINHVSFHYQDGRIDQMGALRFSYGTGQMRNLGDLPVTWTENGLIGRIGTLSLNYKNGRIAQIGDLPFTYDDNGRVTRIGGVSFHYDSGTLKSVTGSIPGVSIIISTTVEFRSRLPAR